MTTRQYNAARATIFCVMTVTLAAQTTATVTWPAVSGATSYAVLRSLPPCSAGVTPLASGLTATSYVDTTSATGDCYSVNATVVQPVTASVVYATTSTPTPPPPTTSSAADLVIDWSGGADGVPLSTTNVAASVHGAATPIVNVVNTGSYQTFSSAAGGAALSMGVSAGAKVEMNVLGLTGGDSMATCFTYALTGWSGSFDSFALASVRWTTWDYAMLVTNSDGTTVSLRPEFRSGASYPAINIPAGHHAWVELHYNQGGNHLILVSDGGPDAAHGGTATCTPNPVLLASWSAASYPGGGPPGYFGVIGPFSWKGGVNVAAPWLGYSKIQISTTGQYLQP